MFVPPPPPPVPTPLEKLTPPAPVELLVPAPAPELVADGLVVPEGEPPPAPVNVWLGAAEQAPATRPAIPTTAARAAKPDVTPRMLEGKRSVDFMSAIVVGRGARSQAHAVDARVGTGTPQVRRCAST
jgi:outer membrane biosynthesis protein TonB